MCKCIDHGVSTDKEKKKNNHRGGTIECYVIATCAEKTRRREYTVSEFETVNSKDKYDIRETAHHREIYLSIDIYIYKIHVVVFNSFCFIDVI